MTHAHDEGVPPPGGQRVVAGVALLTVLAAFGLLLAGLAHNWRGALVSALAMSTVVVAGWNAVSRRGTVRTVSIAVVVGAGAAVIAGFVISDLSGLRMGSAIVLSAISVLTAKVALGRTDRDLRRHASSVPVPPARHPVLIMNLKSGGGKAEKFDLAAACERRGIEAIVLQPDDDLLQLAEDAIERGADVIGMAGGDGSQALVATVASKHDVAHVVIPAGTRNHLALDLGLDRADVVGALDAFSTGTERRIDLATANGRVFVNNASLGLYAKIVQAPEYRDAKLQTAAAMLPEMIGPDAEPLDLRFIDADGGEQPTCHLLMVSNNPYQLSRLGGLGSREHLDRGQLGIVAVQVADAKAAQQLAALQLTGQVSRFSGWHEWSAARFEVRSDEPVEIGIDGEAMTMDAPVVFETLPGALRVRLPRHAIGRSPAARAARVWSGSAARELTRIIVAKPPA